MKWIKSAPPSKTPPCWPKCTAWRQLSYHNALPALMAPLSDDSSERRSCLQAPMPMLKLTQPGPGRTWPKEMLHHHSKYVLLSSVHWSGCIFSWVAAWFTRNIALMRGRFNALTPHLELHIPGSPASKDAVVASNEQRTGPLFPKNKNFKTLWWDPKPHRLHWKKPAIVKSFPAPSKTNIGTWKSHLWKKKHWEQKSWTPIFVVPTCWIVRDVYLIY